ncbi:MAG: hypothetical protein ACT4QF_19635 [Sporichthyaceae bacterium]
MRRIVAGAGLGLAVALTGSIAAGPAAAKIVPPTTTLPAGTNLVVCSEHAPLKYSVDGPSFRSGTLDAEQCRALTVVPGSYAVSQQLVDVAEPHHFASVIRPGGPRAVHQRTLVHTYVAAAPAAPTFGPVDANNVPTGVNSPTSGPGTNVTVVVFHDYSGAGGGAAGGGHDHGAGTGSSGGTLTGPGGITCPPHPVEHCS